MTSAPEEMNVRKWIAIALAVTALSGVPRFAGAEDAAHHVAPGDVLLITVYAGGDKQDEFELEVQAAGAITCPMAGVFAVEGLSVTQVAEKVRGILARDFYVDPEVVVSVKESGGRIYVLGEVKNAGVYSLEVAPTALSACVLAGGFTDFAAPRHGRITRLEEGKPRVIEIDLVKVRQGRRADLPLLAGDRVEVPRRRF